MGLLGGTFDPVHYGHLYLARELKEKLKLHELRLIPCAKPVHRKPPWASAEHRLIMLKRALTLFPELQLDDSEIRRGGQSYTFDTLTAFRQSYPDVVLNLIIGCDAFQSFTGWYRWEAILNLCHIVVVSRPGFKLPECGSEYQLMRNRQINMQALDQQAHGGILFETLSEYPISSTAIRQRIKAKESIKNLTPAAVIEYINQQGLYLNSNAEDMR